VKSMLCTAYKASVHNMACCKLGINLSTQTKSLYMVNEMITPCESLIDCKFAIGT